MGPRFRIIVPLLVVAGAMAAAIGCGEAGDKPREAQASQPNLIRAGDGRDPANADSGDLDHDGDGAGTADRDGDGEQIGGGAEPNAKERVREVVDRFFAAASRGNSRAACSLFVTGATTACKTFFAGAFQTGGASETPPISKIFFREGGEEAVVEFSGFGHQVELEQEDGKWLLEEVPGY